MTRRSHAHDDLVDRFLAALPRLAEGDRWLITKENFEDEDSGFFEEALEGAERSGVAIVVWRVPSGGALVSLTERAATRRRAASVQSVGTLMHPEEEPEDRAASYEPNMSGTISRADQ